MLASRQVVDGKIEALAAFPAHGSLRPGTRGTTWPTSPGFDARLEASWTPPPEVNLVGSPDLQPTVSSMPVVPLGEQGQLIPEYAVVVGDEQLPCALVLDRADESLDDGERLPCFSTAP